MLVSTLLNIFGIKSSGQKKQKSFYFCKHDFNLVGSSLFLSFFIYFFDNRTKKSFRCFAFKQQTGLKVKRELYCITHMNRDELTVTYLYVNIVFDFIKHEKREQIFLMTYSTHLHLRKISSKNDGKQKMHSILIFCSKR